MDGVTEPEGLSVTVNSDVIDVEATVLQIRDKCDKIVNGISSNAYDIIAVDEGVIAYLEQDQIKAIIVKKIMADMIMPETFIMMEIGCFLHIMKVLIHIDCILMRIN